MTTRSSRRKKTRYLSLRRRLAATASTAPMVATTLLSPPSTSHHAQLNLFPLHTGTTLHDSHDDPHDDHLSRFFPTDDAVTLHSLIGPPAPAAAATDHSSSSSVATALSEDPLSPSSSSANYSACSSSYAGGSAAVGLARAALRGRERWWAEEEEEGDVASDGGVAAVLLSGVTRRLSLKLDYDGILSAWSDKGPLFVEGEGPQVVPDIHHTGPSSPSATTVFVEVVGGGGGGLWTVPDGGRFVAVGGDDGRANHQVEEEGEEKTAEGKEDREARVMRYKEKRQHRLFSKRIRYEVRKLNAEKRPRLKGRFVKRDGD